LFEDKFYVKFPVQKVWDFVLDPQKVGPCIPGCEKVESINEKEYDSVGRVKLGFIKMRFKVKTIIEEIVPYTFIRTVGHGSEIHKLGRFKQKTTISFNKLSDDETEVSYRSDVSMVGRLATFGDRIIRAKAKEINKEFVNNLKKKIE